MKENFSKRVQRIIKQSKEEAIRLGHSYVGSEHLLLGMLKEDSGLSRKVLDVFDINTVEMVAMIEDMIKSSGGTMTLGHLPLTRRAERILKNAYKWFEHPESRLRTNLIPNNVRFFGVNVFKIILYCS